MAGGPLAQPNFHSNNSPIVSISAVFAINQLFEEKTSPLQPQSINKVKVSWWSWGWTGLETYNQQRED